MSDPKNKRGKKIPMVIDIPDGLDTPTELQMMHDIADIQKMLSESDNKYDVVVQRPVQALSGAEDSASS